MKTTETKIKRIEDDNGNLLSITHYLNDRIHRDGDNPAHLEYDVNTFKECYYSHDVLHREEGPAVLVWDGSLLIRYEYYINGFLHNEHGPALCISDITHTQHKEYWLNGKKLKKSAWLHEIFHGVCEGELNDKLILLKAWGCYPCISYRGAGTWRAHINNAGNFWEEGRSPLEALDKAIEIWFKNDCPMMLKENYKK